HAAKPASAALPAEQQVQVVTVLPFKGTVRAFEWPWARQGGSRAHAHDGQWHVHDQDTTDAAALGQGGDEATNPATGAFWLGLLSAALVLPVLALARQFGTPLVLDWGTRTAAPPRRPPRLA
ncbi:MAG TPA: hypothetical protein VK439_05455, partial [Rubrivivax sp.]|nr:hypothetical protein [Rubrivivax sp.]